MLRRNVWLTCCVWFGVTATAFGQSWAELIQAIPADAAGFLVVNDLRQTSARIEALAEKLSTPLPDPLAMLKSHAGITVGLAEEGSLAIVFFTSDDGAAEKPKHVLFIPTADYGQLIGSLKPLDATARITEVTIANQKVLSARKGPFAVLAYAEDRATLEKVLDDPTTIADKAQRISEWQAQNQVTLSLPSRGTAFAFSAMDDGLERIKQLAVTSGQNPEMAKAGFEMYQKALRLGKSEFTEVVVGLRVDANRGIEIDKRAAFRPDSQLARIAAELVPRTEPVGAQLPRGPFVMAFDGPLPAIVSQEMMKLSFEMLRTMPHVEGTEPLNDEQIGQLAKESAEFMRGVRTMSMMMGLPEPKTGIYGSTVLLMKVDDARSYLDRYEKTMLRFQELLKNVHVPYMNDYTVERIEEAGQPALKLTVGVSPSDIPQPAGVNVEAMNEALFGPDGKLSVFVAPADDQTVVLAYVSIENLRRGIAAVRSGELGLAGDVEVVKTTAALPATAHWIGYLSLPGTFELSSRMAGAMLPQAAPQFPTFPNCPPLGFATELNSSRVQTLVVVPVETMQAMIKFGVQLRAMVLPQQAPQPLP